MNLSIFNVVTPFHHPCYTLSDVKNDPKPFLKFPEKTHSFTEENALFSSKSRIGPDSTKRMERVHPTYFNDLFHVGKLILP